MIEITPLPSAPEIVTGVVNVRGSVIPVLDISKRKPLKSAMSRQISDRLLTQLSEHVTGWLGLHFPKKSWGDLSRIISHAAQEPGSEDVDAFIGRLVSGHISREQEMRRPAGVSLNL